MSGLSNLVGRTFGLGESSFMSELDAQIPTAFDPFAEANADDSGAGSKEYVHIRVQQRNGRKSLTTVQGLKKEFSYNKILKDVKKEFCCNGTVVQDPELGQVCVDILLSNKMIYPLLLQVTHVCDCRLFNFKVISGRMFLLSLSR
ncbi:translation factor SUI1-like [Spatholobus suberectus]|nr:translation factor SUI1-like [Spatholobus suberectus]